MKYYSTNRLSPLVNAREAILKGLAPDGGLYMPECIPLLPESFFATLFEKSLQEISTRVSREFLGESISEDILTSIVDDALNFPVPVKELDDTHILLELFHGPTLAFKDFGARLMARLISEFWKRENTMLTILVATSGDTGSAVANGFLGIKGIRVVLLYPSGQVSFLQEKQLTTLGDNIHAIEIQGNFDDCQKLVKSAFCNDELSSKLNLTSANSINIARLLAQTFYYFHARNKFPKEEKIYFCVPSGNFGNVTAGLIAKFMGLDFDGIIAATNINDSVPRYLNTGIFSTKPSISTLSNAMDVGNPSNYARMCELMPLYGSMSNFIFPSVTSDFETLKTMSKISKKYEKLICPHTAVGLHAADFYKSKLPKGSRIITLATAHPAKFIDSVKDATGIDIELPKSLSELIDKKKQTTLLAPKFNDFSRFLLDLP